MVEWLSSCVAEQGVRGSNPCLATSILEIGYLLLPSREMYDHERVLKQRKIFKIIQPNHSIQMLNQASIHSSHNYTAYTYKARSSKVLPNILLTKWAQSDVGPPEFQGIIRIPYISIF